MVGDHAHMRRALFHAARAEGHTTPNPMVGAVVVSPDGVVIGQGRHHRAGEPHAEVHALDEAGHAARDATLYVTLEPCCHTGRTGPCTRRIIDAGIRRVVAAMKDPNPRVAGGGFAELRAHGIAVDVGLCEQEARRLNAAFVTVQSRQRPFVMIKAAMSLDGRIAARVGDRTALTSREANRRTHRLRAAVDAVAVGSETVLVDDPLLTVRECYRTRPLTRVVFDRRLRTPPAARLFSTLAAGPVIIVTSVLSAERQPGRVRQLQSAGATIVEGGGSLTEDVRRLLAHGVSSVLLEGGTTIQEAAWAADLVDRVHFVVAPLMLGDSGVPAISARALPLSALSLKTVEAWGPDTWIEADVHWNR